MRTGVFAIGVFGSGFLAAILMGQSSSQPTKIIQPNAVARLAAAEHVCQMLHDETGAPTGHEGVEHSYLWSMRRMEAQREVDAAHGDRFSALESHLQRMRDFEAQINKLYQQKLVGEFELGSTRFYVVEAEELLGREQAK